MLGSFSRRTALKAAAFACTSFSLDWKLDASVRGSVTPIRFGLCADPHKGVIHDADDRLRAFIDALKKERPDFMLELGDFCRPYAKNLPFLKIRV